MDASSLTTPLTAPVASLPRPFVTPLPTLFANDFFLLLVLIRFAPVFIESEGCKVAVTEQTRTQDPRPWTGESQRHDLQQRLQVSA